MNKNHKQKIFCRPGDLLVITSKLINLFAYPTGVITSTTLDGQRVEDWIRTSDVGVATIDLNNVLFVVSVIEIGFSSGWYVVVMSPHGLRFINLSDGLITVDNKSKYVSVLSC